MSRLKLLNTALAVALGMSYGIATAQTDQAAQQGNALDKPSNKADQQAVGIAAKPGTQSGQIAQPNTDLSEERFAQSGSTPGAGGEVYGWRPSEAMDAQQSGERFEFRDNLAQLAVYGWRPNEPIADQQIGPSVEQFALRDEEKTTGQGQGVRESGGQAGVKTPAQSGTSSAEHFAQSGSAPGAEALGTTGGG